MMDPMSLVARNAYPGVRAALNENKSGTQNSDALQDAATRARSRGLPLFLPPGLFDLDPTVIDPWSGMQFIGAGAGNRAGSNDDKSGTSLRTTDASGGDFLSFIINGTGGETRWHLKIEDFELLGIAGSGNGLVIGDDALTNYHALMGVRHVAVDSFGATGIKLGGGLTWCALELCSSRNNGAHGYAIESTVLQSDLRLASCHGNNNTQYGLHLSALTRTLAINSGEYSNNATGVYMDGVTAIANAVTIDGMYCERNADMDIDIASGGIGPVTIRGSKFQPTESALQHIWVRQTTSLVKIEGNAFSNTSASNEVGVHESGTVNVRYDNNLVTNGHLRLLSGGTYTDLENGGATAKRPSSPRAGQDWFDTTLGYPVWFDGTNWVDATGATA